MADDADWAADLAERERQALIERHRRRLPPPAPPRTRPPAHLSLVMDEGPNA
jgi:hypothetical protein